jgi:RNA polymerase sigma-70 factor (ECF subfamily)
MDEPRRERTEQWLRRILEEYGQDLRHSIARLCPKGWGIRPEEVEQEVHIRLWRALSSEKPVRNWPSYLYRMAANATIDALRQVRARREDPLLSEEDDSDPAPGPRLRLRTDEPAADATAERRELLAKVQKALGRLPESRAQAVGLYLRGFALEEISGLMDWSFAKTRNLVYRGLEGLRRELRSEGIEHEDG